MNTQFSNFNKLILFFLFKHLYTNFNNTKILLLIYLPFSNSGKWLQIRSHSRLFDKALLFLHTLLQCVCKIDLIFHVEGIAVDEHLD